MGDLQDEVSAVVQVKEPGECNCVDDLAARAKLTKIQLTWTYNGAHHFNVYRSTVEQGPYVLIGTTESTYSTYLDTSVNLNTPYYYDGAGANELNQELCQSNEASATAVVRVRR